MAAGPSLALIPARGGSKGVPRKNIRLLAGRPLIAYSIRAAKEARSVSRVIVSTDDREIARAALAEGAEVPFLRPSELARDDTTDLPVFQHCLEWLREREGFEPEIVVHLRPTAPLRTAEHIDASVELLMANPEVDCVRTVCVASEHPLKTWRMTEHDYLEPFVDPTSHEVREPYNEPRQRLPRAFVQNGSVDAIRTQVIRDGSMSGRHIKGMVMDALESVNIDREIDFRLAELLLAERSPERT